MSLSSLLAAVNRLHCRASTFDVDMVLDVNSELFEAVAGDRVSVVFAKYGSISIELLTLLLLLIFDDAVDAVTIRMLLLLWCAATAVGNYYRFCSSLTEGADDGTYNPNYGVSLLRHHAVAAIATAIAGAQLTVRYWRM